MLGYGVALRVSGAGGVLRGLSFGCGCGSMFLVYATAV